MMSGRAAALRSLDAVNAALDAQQEAMKQFRETISSLAGEIESLAVGATRYCDGLAYAGEANAALGAECRNFAVSRQLEKVS